MSQDIIQAAQKERERLLSELRMSAAYQRLMKIEDLLQVYGIEITPLVSQSSSKPWPLVGTQYKPASKMSKREQIEKLAVECVGLKGSAHSDTIDAYLKKNSIVDVTRQSLSAYLSRTPQIKFDHRRGWVFKDSDTPLLDSGEENKTAGVAAPAVNGGGASHHHPTVPKSINELL